MANEHENEKNPWNIELASTVPFGKNFEQTTILHFGREISEHLDFGVFASFIGKEWSEKKGQFYGADLKCFLKPFSADVRTNIYVSLGMAYNTMLEHDVRIDEFRYGWKFGLTENIYKEFSVFAETGVDLLFNPETNTYRNDISGLLVVGLKYDF